MRRSLSLSAVFVAVFGMLVVMVPTASAADDCGGDFAKRLDCWVKPTDSGFVLITLDDELPLDEKDLDGLDTPDRLVVEVPPGKRTGKGGTALLLLADDRLVARNAQVDRLPEDTVEALRNAGACAPERDNLCEMVTGTGKPLSGDELIKKGRLVLDRAENRYFIADQDGRPSWLVLSMSILLGLLLIALLVMIRRSRAPGAPRPALAAVGADAVPSGPRPSAHERADDSTTHLRATPARSHGREVGGRSGPARTAVVRTELRPQGYVEMDRILYRAVWAEHGRPPPAPGSPVDVTDARERDSDVLYAFPPAAGRHAKGSR